MNSIDTYYRGYKFRSRLEARWAVFLTHLGVDWRYEEQGYVSDRYGAKWLPDFYLPGLNLHVEVKGPHSPDDFKRIVQVMDDTTAPWYDRWPGQEVWSDYGWGIPSPDGTSYGVLVLGEVPEVQAGAVPRHDCLRSSAGDGTIYASTGFFSMFDDSATGARTTFQVAPQYPDIRPPQNREVGYYGRLVEMPLLNPLPMSGEMHSQLASAYRAARAARFERGARA